jgi:HEAT repeat protein
MTRLRKLDAAQQLDLSAANAFPGNQGVRVPDGAAASAGQSPAAGLGKFNCVAANGCGYFSAPRVLLARADKNTNGASEATSAVRARISALTKQLASSDAEIVGGALDELGAMGLTAADAVPAIARLFDGPIGYGWRAAPVLGMIGSEQAVRELTRVVASKKIPNYALSAAIAALEQVGPKARTAVPALAKVLLKDTDSGLRRAAAYALGAIGSPRGESALMEGLKHEVDQSVRKAIVFALSLIREGPGVRQGVKDLIRDLADDHLGMRYRAIRLLGDMHSDAEAAVPALVEIVLNPGKNLPAGFTTLRREAIAALGEIGALSAVPALVEVIQKKPSGPSGQQSRRDAIVALQMFGKKAQAVAPLLEKIVGDAREDQELRHSAITALWVMEAASAAPTLRRVLRDGDPRIRGTAAFALGMIGDRKAMGELARAKGDPDEYVRSSAEQALRTLSANGKATSAKSSTNVRASVWDLVKTLRDRNPVVKAQALGELASRGVEATSAIPAIHGALRDTDPLVRDAAAKALAAIGASIVELGKAKR